MWALIRTAALAVLVLVGVLLAGHGGWVLNRLDALVGLGGLGPLPRQPGASREVVVGGVAAGVVAAVVRPVGRVVAQVVTLLHELGHTLVAAALGARPAGIVLRHDASGHATARWMVRPGPVRRLSLAATAVVGLPAPTVAVAAGVGLLLAAGPRAVLWSLAAAGGVVALLARSPWSLLAAVGLVGAALAGLAEVAAPWAAGGVVALLAAVAVRSATDAVARLRRPIPTGDDARAVQRHLAVPARLVQLVQVVITVTAAAWAGRLLASATELAPQVMGHLGVTT